MSHNTAARVIVCEPSPRWAVLLRRFAPELQVSEARSLTLADGILRENETTVVAVAVSRGNVTDVLLKLAQWQRDYPASASAVLLERFDDDVELALREAGAQMILTSLFELPQLAGLALRMDAHATA